MSTSPRTIKIQNSFKESLEVDRNENRIRYEDYLEVSAYEARYEKKEVNARIANIKSLGFTHVRTSKVLDGFGRIVGFIYCFVKYEEV